MKKAGAIFILIFFLGNVHLAGACFSNSSNLLGINPNDSINRWRLALGATQSFNYPIMHTTPSVSIYNRQHAIYCGPEFTLLLKKSLGDDVDSWKQKYWGFNLGYRYTFPSHWKRTNLFLQMNYSIYQYEFEEGQMGSGGVIQKGIMVENCAAIGVNYRCNSRLSLSGGIGLGSKAPFFLLLNSAIPHSFVGVSYQIW